MRDDDDVLADYDLSAWEVPPPSPGLADAVIARAKQPAGVAPVEELAGKPAPRRRGLVIGGVLAAALVAALAFVTWGTERAPRDGAGDVIAEKAQRVELGESRVQLDPGAELHWRRDKHRLSVALPRGAASWDVDEDDTLVIDAGAMVASVEATGASLRVEVKMNLSDGRVVGASALTAAVVALVTVIVYEGHVKVSSAGKTVVVEPGSRLEVKNPALEPPPVAASVTPEMLAEKQRQIDELERRLDELGGIPKTAPAPDPEPKRCDEVSCVLNDDTTGCCEKFKKTPKKPPAETPADCPAAELAKKGDAHIQSGMDAAALAAFEASLRCKADPLVVRKAAIAACRSRNAPKAKLYFGRMPEKDRTALAQICVRNGIDIADGSAGDDEGEGDAAATKGAKAKPACDADALREKGNDHLQTGMDAAALLMFERSLECKADSAVERLAFLAACRGKNVDAARVHYVRIAPGTRKGLLEVCARNGITEASLQKAPTGPGTLVINAEPAAEVFVDGEKVGETPLRRRVSAGKHRITLKLGDRQWTYTATVESGKTESITKDLR